jgi:hypothetical protein
MEGVCIKKICTHIARGDLEVVEGEVERGRDDVDAKERPSVVKHDLDRRIYGQHLRRDPGVIHSRLDIITLENHALLTKHFF